MATAPLIRGPPEPLFGQPIICQSLQPQCSQLAVDTRQVEFQLIDIALGEVAAGEHDAIALVFELRQGRLHAERFEMGPLDRLAFFGAQPGRVTAVAASASLPDESLHVPFKFAGPVYRVSALPTATHISAYGRDFPLKAGMTLSADVQLEQRSLLQWLLEPIYSIRGRLI